MLKRELEALVKTQKEEIDRLRQLVSDLGGDPDDV